MKLSNRSASRRLQKWVFSESTPPTNLCAHVRTTLFAVCLLPMILISYVIFVPIFLVGSVVEVIKDKMEARRLTLRKIGESFTVEQAYRLARRAGIIRNKNFEYGDFEWHTLIRYSNNRKIIILRGWAEKHTRNSANLKGPSAAELMDEYIETLRSKKVDTGSLFIKIREVVCSYLPTVYKSIAIAGGLFIALMYFGYLISIDTDAQVASFSTGVLLGFVWISLTVWLWRGVKNISEKYGKQLKDDIFILYLKAIKNRMCPLIEWVD